MSDILTVGSMFAGIAGFDLGFERAGFRTAWQIEVDRDCVSVLARHWPDTRRLGDIREADPSDLEPVDVVVFGSPCQGFSVAGKREGLDDERSGLFGQAIRVIRGLRPGPSVICWENVPGAFTTGSKDDDDPDRDVRGGDFAAVLAALANSGAMDIGWSVVDSQGVGDCLLHREQSGFWAVPQRRRRIFLVADLGGRRAAEILALPDRLSRNPQPRVKARKGTASPLEAGAGGDSPSVAAEGGNRTSGPIDVATALLAHGGSHGHQDFESETFVVETVTTDAGENQPAATLRCQYGEQAFRGDGSDNLIVDQVDAQGVGVADTLRSHPRPGSNTVGAIVAIQERGRADGRNLEMQEDLAYALTAPSGGGRRQEMNVLAPQADAVAYSIYPKGDGSPDVSATETDVAQAITANHGTSQNRRGTHVVEGVAFSENQRGEVVETAYAHQLTTGGGKPGQGYPSVRTNWIVRRLMPVECERLQGFPDSWTQYRADGSEIADGPRYRMLGNAVSVTVAYWLACRVRAALEASA